MNDTDVTPDPVPVSLKELATITAQSRAPVQTLEERFAAAQKTRPTTPAGLPRGFAWRPHDTGKLGYAAQRRLRQRERQAAKHAAKDTTHD